MHIIPAILLLPLALVQAQVASTDYFCGLNWPNAANSCPKHCPTGDDTECQTELGSQYKCYQYTGCRQKIDSGLIDDPDGDSSSNSQVDVEEGTSSGGGGVGSNNFCGSSWIQAMLSCNAPCPTGTECNTGSGEKCFAATGCDKPLERLKADMLITLLGPDATMEGPDGDIFTQTISSIIEGTVENEGVALNDAQLGEQSVANRRQLEHRYRYRELKGWMKNDERSGMKLSVDNVTQRMLPQGSSALDVSMVITGDYRPPPYLDLNVLVEESINRQGSKVVDTLRERGSREGRSFFDRVDGIEAVSNADFTQRPTRKPTRIPTASPVVADSESPSGLPSYSPTSFPSSVPSRDHDQLLMTGSREDLQLGGTTTSSYGYLFNIRTPPGGGVVMITGYDFYTEQTEDVTFELWTRLESFKDYKGTYEGWDLIASGSVQGRGIGRYTSIPTELFTPVSIPGDGGTRGFYITLDKKELVYKIGVGTNSDVEIQTSNEDIEIWEGESVLSYPFPSVEDFFYYRFPRQFLGTVRYNRLPCRPLSLFGPVYELPCPEVPTGSPTLPQPTKAPVTEAPTGFPTPAPIGVPTIAPTISRSPAGPPKDPTTAPTEPMPTQEPTSAEPTLAPIVPQRANVVSIFRNVPERDMTEREIDKFLSITKYFLSRHTSNSMVIEGIDLWHHKLTLVDAYESTDKASSGKSQLSRGTLEKKQRNGNSKKDVIPQVTAVEITMILRISINFLEHELLAANLAAVTIDEKQSELLSLLNEQSAFYTYFKEMDGIQSRAVELLTDPPTLRPTTQQEFLQNQGLSTNNDDIEESKEGAGFVVIVGIAVGVLWCCLTVVSLSYLMKRRSEMQEEHDMDDLLRQRAQSSLTNAMSNTVSNLRSSLKISFTSRKADPVKILCDGIGDSKEPKVGGDEENPGSSGINEEMLSKGSDTEHLPSQLRKQNSTANDSNSGTHRHSQSSNHRGRRQRAQGSLTMSNLRSSLKRSFSSKNSSEEPSAHRKSVRRVVNRSLTGSLSRSSRRSSHGSRSGSVMKKTQKPAVAHSMVVSSKASNISSSIRGGQARRTPPGVSPGMAASMLVSSSASAVSSSIRSSSKASAVNSSMRYGGRSSQTGRPPNRQQTM